MDGFFPTDGLGDFSRPLNPGLTSANFAGRDLAGIRELYAGSGGGTTETLKELVGKKLLSDFPADGFLGMGAF